jgi:hypothetical protein
LKKRILFPVIILLVLATAVVLVHWRARQILISLVESSTENRVQLTIGQLTLNPLTSSINLKDAVILAKDPASKNYNKSEFRHLFLDVASLWEFIQGGTLIIEKFECEGGDITLFNQAKRDSTAKKFTLASLLQHIQTDVIRFQIQDFTLKDINVHIIQDSLLPPISIQHIHAHARKLYLSADSVRNHKPEIGLSMPAQQLDLPNGEQIQFDTLFFSNADNSIQLNQLLVESPTDQPLNTYHLEADKVRISHVDFERLYTQGKLAIDSIAFEHGNLKSYWTVAATKADTTKTKVSDLLPEILINQVYVNQLASELTIRKDDVESSFNLGYSRVTIDRLHHKPDSSHVLSIRDFSIVLARYQTFLSNRKTSIAFDTIRLQKDQLDLMNFKLHLAGQQEPVLQTSIFRLRQADWDELLFNKNLIAQEAVAIKPIIRLRIQPPGNDEPKSNLVILNTLKEFLDVQRLTLQNAQAFAYVVKDSTNLSLNGFNASIQFNQIIEAGTLNQATQAINHLSFRDLYVSQPTVNGHIKGFALTDKNPTFQELKIRSGNTINLTLQDVTLRHPIYNSDVKHISLSGLTWRNMMLNLVIQPAQPKVSQSPLPAIRVNDIRGGATEVQVTTPTLHGSTKIHHVNLDQLILGDSIEFNGFDLSGEQLKFDQKNINASIGHYHFTDKDGKMEHIEFNQIDKDTLQLSVQSVISRWNLTALAQKIMAIEQLSAESVIVKYHSKDSLNSLRIHGHHSLQLNDLHFQQSSLAVRSLIVNSSGQEVFIENKVTNPEPVEEDSRQSNAARFRQTYDSLVQTRVTPGRLTRTTLHDSLSDRNSREPVDTLRFIHIQSPSGGVGLSLQNLVTTFQDSGVHISTEIPALYLHQLNLKTNSLTARIPSGSIGQLSFNSDQANNLRQLLQTNLPKMALANLKAQLETRTSTINFEQLNYNPSLKRGTITGFEFRPNQDKDEYLNSRYYQTDYIRTKIESITFSNPGLHTILEDSVIRLSSLTVNGPALDIHRDKTHPFMSTAIRPLPTNAFQKARFRFNIDSLALSNGHISYTEKSRITGREGVILLTETNGMVRHIKNTDLQNSDSLSIRASTRFLDSAQVNLQFKESYYDSLGGFKLTAQLGPFNTSILNPVLLPLVAVEFKSGAIDTMMMSSIGREHISLGSMKFFYHDLKVEFLDKQDSSKHSLKNAVLKFAANTFVVRTNNKDRIGTVYYERDRNRGVFQYWVKMILSGVTTSVGARTNKHQIRQYKKNLKINKIPPIDQVLIK